MVSIGNAPLTDGTNDDYLLGCQVKTVATLCVLLSGSAARVSSQPFHARHVPVDGRLVQGSVSYARFFVQISHAVYFQKSANQNRAEGYKY